MIIDRPFKKGLQISISLGWQLVCQKITEKSVVPHRSFELLNLDFVGMADIKHSKLSL